MLIGFYRKGFFLLIILFRLIARSVETGTKFLFMIAACLIMKVIILPLMGWMIRRGTFVGVFMGVVKEGLARLRSEGNGSSFLGLQEDTGRTAISLELEWARRSSPHGLPGTGSPRHQA